MASLIAKRNAFIKELASGYSQFISDGLSFICGMISRSPISD